MTISDLMDIYYPSNFGCFDKTGVFQQSQAMSLKTRPTGTMSEILIAQQLGLETVPCLFRSTPD